MHPLRSWREVGVYHKDVPRRDRAAQLKLRLYVLSPNEEIAKSAPSKILSPAVGGAQNDSVASIVLCYFTPSSPDRNLRRSCKVAMNWLGKMMVEFFSAEISRRTCRFLS
jgi:hypothetical protein